MQAIILAAGMGKRLGELTRENTKCMVKVNGISLIERTLFALDKKGLSKIVIVVGFGSENLLAFLKTLQIKTPITFVHNEIYDKTNNIYSLYLAKEYLEQEDTLLLESDIIFEECILDKIINDSNPNIVLVSKYKDFMDGTTVTLDNENKITGFYSKSKFDISKINEYYKTVNIYKFGKEFSQNFYLPFLETYIKVMGRNEYYEYVLKTILALEKDLLRACILHDELWYEIDDKIDLENAEKLF